MELTATYYYLLFGWVFSGMILLPLMLKVTAPYGRHTLSTWGPMMNNRWGWIIMEMPALLIVPILFGVAEKTEGTITWVFVALWVLHYFHRTLIFPFRIRTKGKKIPILIVGFAFLFNLINGYFNGFWLATQSAIYSLSWFEDVRMWLGMLLFVVGMGINWKADYHLLGLRKPGEIGYKIPLGGLFKHVSCPNHFGEILEWTGFAIMTWSPAGAAFAIWTAFNLIPRSLDHHRWYHRQFPAYPKERKAVIPFLI